MKIYRFPSLRADKKLKAIVERGLPVRSRDVKAVERILAEVKKSGDRALLAYTRRFDAPDMKAGDLIVTREEMTAALREVDRTFVRALNRAAAQIEDFHSQQRQHSWFNMQRPGTLLGQLVHPVAVAGVYVPGGKGGETPLVSSVLMGAIPARIAGVERIVMATPPRADGSVNPHLLAAARKAGVETVFKAGSAWAIAALAYGTESVPRADVIVGPGNIFVTLAKKIVAGTVAIDMIAGPSEVLVIADHTANPQWVAADLLSQAEHDALSSAVLVTADEEMAKAVAAAVDERLPGLVRKEVARASVDRFGAVFVTADLDSAVALANRIAPEHLELQVAEPLRIVGSIRNAGAIFMGPYTPEPVGDYVAGPNHVLPTAGTARFSSALSVGNFLKQTSLIYYSRSALAREGRDIVRLATVEGLDAHAQAVRVRMGPGRSREKPS